MKRMLVIKPHRFRGKPAAPGSEYMASKSEARLVQALGWAALAPPVQSPPPEPTSFFDEETVVEKPKRKYTYKRRDLKAESNGE